MPPEYTQSTVGSAKSLHRCQTRGAGFSMRTQTFRGVGRHETEESKRPLLVKLTSFFLSVFTPVVRSLLDDDVTVTVAS